MGILKNGWMKTVLALTVIALWGGTIATHTHAQFDKIKKAVDGDKKDKKDKKEKKDDKKTDKKKKDDSKKEDEETKTTTTTTTGSSGTAGGTKKVDDGKSIEDCDDTKIAKGYLYWIEQYLTEYNNPFKAEETLEKSKESLKKAKTSCPDVDASSIETKLAEYEKQIAVKIKEANAKQNAEKMLQDASFMFDAVIYNILDRAWEGMFKKKDEAQKLYDECVKLDYPKKKKQLDDLLAADADLKAKANEEYGGYTAMMKSYMKFEESVNTFLVKEIDRAIEEAYAQKAKGKNNLNNAQETAEAGLLTAQAILLVIPDHAQTLKLQKDVQTILDAIDKELGGSVYTSAIHKKNVGKIVFSKSPIVIKAEKEDGFTSNFTGNDYIYAMAYLKGPLEALAYNWECTVKIYVDGDEKKSRSFTASEQAKKQTWLDFEIVPDAATSTQYGCVEYSKALSEISPRNHTVKVEFWDKECIKQLAVGEFNLDASTGMETLQNNAKKLAQKALDKVRMPAAGMKNTAFEQKIMSDWTNERYKALRAVIYDKDWSIQRNAITGLIEHRYVWCAVAVKTTDGDCKIFYVSYKQDYAGGSYGAFKGWGVGDNELINCDNVNK